MDEMNRYDAAVRDPQRHATREMQCMEVWGGNTAIDSGLSVPGIDAWIHSQPSRGQRSGGDIYYASMCGAGRIGRFVLADVSGHGPGDRKSVV